MSRLETALHAGHWELAAHVLVFAALHTLSNERASGEQHKKGCTKRVVRGGSAPSESTLPALPGKESGIQGVRFLDSLKKDGYGNGGKKQRRKRQTQQPK